MSEDGAEDACLDVRQDGRSVDVDGDYTETLARIDANPDGVGIFGLAFYREQPRQAESGDDGRHRAVDGNDFDGPISCVSSVVLLCEESPHWV